MTGAYIAYPYDADNLPLTDADIVDVVRNFDVTDAEGRNALVVDTSTYGYAYLEFVSTGLVAGPFQSLQMIVNAEEGFYVGMDGSILNVTPSEMTIQANAYTIGNPSAFRDAIGVYQTFGEYIASIAAITTDPGIENAPWNDNGTFKFSTGSLAIFLRPDGFAQYYRPDGVSTYQRA